MALDSAVQASSVGVLLQTWRKARHLSQLALANEAGVSPRHVCFLETGRAKPSREMVAHLAEVLDVPLRERNALLLAAGFAPIFQEPSLDAPELAPVRRALDAMLAQQEPYPAVVLDRRWEILRTNKAAERLFGMLLAGQSPREPTNLLHLMFDPAGARPFVANWEEVAEALVQRAQRESLGGVRDERIEKVVADVLRYPNVPARVRGPSLSAPLVPVIPVRFSRDGRTYSYFSAVTTLGSPQDVTSQEIRLECLFPLDDETIAAARRLAG